MPESERTIVKMMTIVKRMTIVKKMTLMTNMTRISITIMTQMVNVINVLMANITFSNINDIAESFLAPAKMENISQFLQ